MPEGVRLIRHDKSLGIVASKNVSLAALMVAGCEHLFLWDDDAWPVADGWWLPYIDSPEPHLAYQFLDLAGARKLNDIAVLYRDDKHVAYTGQRGVMLYYHRSVIERVGGFDPIYGRGMYEHSDLALRIHNAGLGMSIEPDGSAYKSTVVVAADQFGVYSGNNPGNWQAAFFVYNGQVFIRSALIQEASIDFAKITDTLQSSNYVAGVSGWRLGKGGDAEFHGRVYATSGQFSFNGTNNTVVLDDNGLTVNLTGGGMIRVGKW